MTRQEAFDEINQIQDGYVNELIGLINNPDYESMKTINFTSPTGTGKTKMMSKLINALPDYYYVITTLSKGQLHLQVRDSLQKDCKQENFTVYGSADYKINSRLDAEDIISRIPDKTRCIWLRDEGHIRTNRFDELLLHVCYKVVNFSATNTYSDIQCKFSQTMMLRTVNQVSGTPADAINRLLEIKASHKMVRGYNPCAIFRCVGAKDRLYDEIIELCKQHHLKYIDITDDPFVMAELCRDDNENDVIINKFKIIEGIDIRRAHVLFMDNYPSNNATTIQAIGRCRRNALLYREDIDILAPGNEKLLRDTRECYVYYYVENMKIDEDIEGELQYAFCNQVSCEELKANTTIHVENGQLSNGLYILELRGQTGDFRIITDEATGFNVVQPKTVFYAPCITEHVNFLFQEKTKVRIENVPKFPLRDGKYYLGSEEREDVVCDIPKTIISLFKRKAKKYTIEYLYSKLSEKCLDVMMEKGTRYDIKRYARFVQEFISENRNRRGYIVFCSFLSEIGKKRVKVYDSETGSTLVFTLDELFSDNELVLLQYFGVKQIKDGNKTYEIEHKIDGFANLKFCHYRRNKRAEQITFLVLKHHIKHIRYVFRDRLIIHCEYPNELQVSKSDIEEYYRWLEMELNQDNDESWYYASFNSIATQFFQGLHETIENLEKGIIDVVYYSYKPLFEKLTEEEAFLIRNKYVPKTYYVQHDSVSNLGYIPYKKAYNDRESAIVGVDLMRQVKDERGNVDWVESKTVTSKVGNYNKLNAFLSRKYASELEQGAIQCFSGKNYFSFDKRCNSMIGYCVEYYSKYLVYGREYLRGFLSEDTSDDYDVVRACVQRYKRMMIECFGRGVTRFIKGISEEQLRKEKYRDFVSLVVELGTRTATFVNETLYKNQEARNNVDPNLSIQHINGLADYITEDTILDVKVRNNIDERCVRQVLAYHYLSTKRSDLHIKRVIVYDATSDRAVTIDISDANIVS